MIEKVLLVFSQWKVHRWARQTGLVKRQGRLNPFDFLLMMVFTPLATIAPSLESMVTYLDHSDQPSSHALPL